MAGGEARNLRLYSNENMGSDGLFSWKWIFFWGMLYWVNMLRTQLVGLKLDCKWRKIPEK